MNFPSQGTLVGGVKSASLGLNPKLVHYPNLLLLELLSQAEVRV